MPLREIGHAREACADVRLRARAIHHEVLAPTIKDMAMGIGKIVSNVGFEFMRARLITINGGIHVPHGRAVRGFHLCRMKDPFLEINRASWIKNETIGCMMSICGSDAVEDPLAEVGFASSFGVLHENNVRGLSNQHAAIVELKPGGAVQVVSKDRALVSLAVGIGIFQDEQLVIHFILGFPVGVGRPHRDPETALCVPCHLNWLGEIGKVLFRREEIHLHSGRQLHMLDGLLRVEELVLAVRARTGLIRFHGDLCRSVIVIDGKLLALRRRPDPLVPVRGHGIQHLHLALQHVPVADIVHVFELGAAAVHVVPIHGAIAVEPVKILVQNCSANFFKLRGIVLGHRIGEQSLDDDRREQMVSQFIQMDAVYCQRFG